MHLLSRSLRIATLCLLFAVTGPAVRAGAADVESGTFTVEVYRVSFIGSATHGTGVLHFGGKSYKFKAKGLGAGGFGASKTTVTGTVYNLKTRGDFAGTFVNVRSGLTVGDASLAAKSLWIENEKGVRLKGKPDVAGAQLNLGADGVLVTWAD